jgi:ribosomal protein S18 acetylase RimI-like enzyme
MTIRVTETDAEIAATWDVMRQLRTHLDRESYVARIRGMMTTDGYRLVSLVENGEVCAVAGYRIMDMLYCGRLLYIDDLVTDESVRSHGLGGRLLDWLKSEGVRLDCREIQLISRTTREAAHRFYFKSGMGIECFHFRAKL